MKSISKILVAILVLLSYSSFNAQIKNKKIETITIYGNCGMCKSKIEKAGNIKDQASVVWDKETKMANIAYDSLKTTKGAVLKRIALAGYDNDIFLAPDDTYASLPSCCQYERAKKTAAKIEGPKMDGSDHMMHSNATMKDSNPLSAVYENYFAVKDALVKTDANLASMKAKNLLAAIDGVKMTSLKMDVHMAWMKVISKIKEDSKHIAETKDVSHQREHFATLSKNLYEVIKLSKQETTIYYQFCPMADDGKGANWLSKEETIMNPYYGSKMLSCGKTVETIKK